MTVKIKKDAITRAPFNNVEKPKHYNSHPSGVETIRVTAHHDFTIGNAIKYIWRAGLKNEGSTNEIQDLGKAVQYLKFHISLCKHGDPRAEVIDSPAPLTGNLDGLFRLFDEPMPHPSGIYWGDVACHHDVVIANVFKLLWDVGTRALTKNHEALKCEYAIRLLEYKMAQIKAGEA